MDPLESVARWGLYPATFLVALASGFCPLVNTEAYLVCVSAVSAETDLGALALLSTLGQMAAKSVLYLAGRGVLALPLGGHGRRLGEIRARMEGKRGAAGGFVLASAFWGVPPFYLVSVLAGTLRWPYPLFALAGSCGRLFRFAVALSLPQYLKGALS